MPLIDPARAERFDLPHDPGGWIELRPITARMIADLEKGAQEQTKSEIMLRLLQACIVAWSFPVPVTAENIGRLDFETFQWLDEIVSRVGRRSEEEKKDSASPSSPAPALEEGGSLSNSHTSARSPG